MALVGFSKVKYSKITETTDENGNVRETYGPVKHFSKGVSASTSFSYAESKLHADNGVAESVKEFVEGRINFTGDDVERETEADVTGATLDEKTGDLIDKDTDVAPYLRWGGIIRRMKRNATQYSTTIFTKVKFEARADDYETKGENIVFKPAVFAGEILRNVEHKWRIRSKWFESESEAEAWLNENIAPTNA